MFHVSDFMLFRQGENSKTSPSTLNYHRFAFMRMQLRLVCLTLFILLANCTYFVAQDKAVDSLRHALAETKTDTNRIKILIQLSDHITGKAHSPERITYLEAARELAEKLDKQKLLSSCLRKTGDILVFSRNDSVVDRATDSLGLGYFMGALKISEALGDLDECGEIMMDVGGIYYDQSSVKTLEAYSKALAFFRRGGNTNHCARAMRNMGSVLFEDGQYQLSLQYFIDASKIWESQGNKRGISSVNTFIGMSYAALGLNQKALESYSYSLRVSQEIDYKESEGCTLNDMAIIFQNEGQYAKAMEYNNKAIRIMNELEMDAIAALFSLDLGDTYFALKQYPRAIVTYTKALHTCEQLRVKRGLATANLDLGRTYAELGDTARARTFYTTALRIADKQNKPLVAHIYQNLGHYYEQLKQFKKAYSYFQLCADQKDKIETENKAKQMVGLESAYDNERRKTQLTLLKRKAAIQEQVNEIGQLKFRKSVLIGGSIAGSVICLLLIIFLLLSQINLRIRNRKADLGQKLLRAQICPDFIYQSLLTLKDCQSRFTKEQSSYHIYSFAKLMRFVLENSARDFVPLENDLTILKYYVELQRLRFQDNFNCVFEIDSDLETDLISIPPLLSQPFLEDVVEHWNQVSPSMKCDTTIRYTQVEGGMEIELLIATSDILKLPAAQKTLKTIKSIFESAVKITEDRLKLLNEKATQKIIFVMTELKQEPSNIISSIKFTVPDAI